MMTDERVMIFIDGSNFYHGLKRIMFDSQMLNFYSFSRFLTKNRKLIRTYYYAGVHSEHENPEKYQSQKRFLDHLRATPYCTVRTGHLLKRGDIYVEKGVDVMLTVDLLRLARLNSYDTGILISGDGDFVEAVRDAQEMGKHIELAYFNTTQSAVLKNTCDYVTEITDTLLTLAAIKKMPVCVTPMPGMHYAK